MSLLQSSVSGTLLAFLITLACVLLVRKIIQFWKLFRLCQSVPGENGYSLIYGNIHLLAKDYEGIIADNFNYMQNVNARIKRFWLGPVEPVIFLLHPELIQEFLKLSPPKTRGFGGGYEHSIPWLGESVLTSNGARWRRDRGLINNAFHLGNLKNYIPFFNSAADTFVEVINKHADSGQGFEIFRVASPCLFDIITKSALSLDVDAQRHDHPFVSASRQLTAIWALRNKTLTLWPFWIFSRTEVGKTFLRLCKFTHKIADDIVKARSERLTKTDVPSSSRHMDFLDLLLNAEDENGQTMTPKEVRENVDAIMFAGHDTGSSSLSWFLYMMAKHPKYQKIVQKEVDAVLNGRDSNMIHYDDFGQLRQLTMCLKESMRLHPAISTLSRRIDRNTTIEGKTFPPGTIVGIPILYVHRNPAVWERPLEYVPERFSPENAKKIPPFAYIPFSAGSRNCVGQHFAMMELKVIIGKILRDFEFELDPEGPPVKKAYEMVVKTEHGIWLKAKRRK